MYESYYGLSDKPFKLSPDPQFFFESAHHSKAISYLRYGLELGEGFIVVTGPIGTGKTTIARSLIVSLDESITAAQIATTRLNPEQLVTMVAANFGLQVEGLNKADILRRLENYFFALYQQGKRALLIIDEAQNLSAETIEELRMLSNFQADGKPLIQSFLLGQEELKPIIELPEMEQFRQRIIASCHLKSFNIDETKNYILHRLRTVGWNENPSLDSDIFDLITNYTGGIPRKINIFMDRLFLYAFMEGIGTITLDHIQSIIEELGEELSGGLKARRPEPTAFSPLGIKAQEMMPDVHIPDMDRAHRTLMDVMKVLDEEIYRKTMTLKNLDKMIVKKRNELSQVSEPSFLDNTYRKK
ncbi:XrtA/PEP-CTERM system-associated ATPase [Vibrio ziniensis]|uniref:AAA family ATPase n=1 Tax=Vibrio ziniensis TaxID=2711221 RepID=A0A6G7CQW3_9VIBR|nr:XrtA/PEP-CTERM system-associated ATPase [Vibrio ziniensis]QIH44492.1 AAA family ATPase [Vibrio ziniensis]